MILDNQDFSADDRTPLPPNPSILVMAHDPPSSMIDPMGRQSRVVIAVDPRLLAAALARSLHHAGAEVLDLSETPEDDPAGRQPFDVAVVSSGKPVPAAFDVAVTIRLPEAEGQPGFVTIRGDAVQEPVDVVGLETIFALVERFSPRALV
jgi:hypothetical protein